jgi:hypothetical protein
MNSALQFAAGVSALPQHNRPLTVHLRPATGCTECISDAGVGALLEGTAGFVSSSTQLCRLHLVRATPLAKDPLQVVSVNTPNIMKLHTLR